MTGVGWVFVFAFVKEKSRSSRDQSRVEQSGAEQ